MLTLKLVEEAENRIKAHVVKTPLVFSDYLSRTLRKNVYLKLESQQYTSSFKPRPAFNNILARLDEVKSHGVIASSSGNFAQAVAYAAQKLNVSALIVMMRSASKYKKTRTKMYGAEILECGDSFDERQALLKSKINETGRILLHQYDSDLTMAGDATIAKEILSEIKDDCAVICPTSGGGLTAALSFVIKELRPQSQIFGVLPHTHAWPKPKAAEFSEKTIADALVPAKAGENTFPIVQKYVDDLPYVTNQEIKSAMKVLAAEQRLIIEPGGAAPVAALLANKLKISHENVVCVLTGGNIDFSDFTQMIS